MVLGAVKLKMGIGTWQSSDGGTLEVPSNITRLARALLPISSDGIPQVCSPEKW